MSGIKREELHSCKEAQFVDENYAELVQRVTSVMALADDLKSKNMIHEEKYSEIKEETTRQGKMRKLYEALHSGGDEVKTAFYNALCEHEPQLFNDLGGYSRKRKLSDPEGQGPAKHIMTMSTAQRFYEVEGYIHQVSPVLHSANSEYFTALLQEAGQNTRVVVFDLQHHIVFQRLEKNRSPVKLGGVTLSPSVQNKGETVIVNRYTKVIIIQNLSFAFDEGLKAYNQTRKLIEIISDVREYQRVTVQVKVISLLFEKDSVTQSYQKVKTKTYSIADKTSSMDLTLWGDGNLEIGKWYQLQNVSVREFNQKACLSTTLQTEMEVLEDCGSVVETVQAEIVTIEGEVIGTELKVNHLCPKNHVMENVNGETFMNRCTECNVFCKTAKIFSRLNGHILIEVNGVYHKIMMDDGLIRKLLGLSQHFYDDTDILAYQVLSRARLRVQMMDQLVLKAQFVEASVPTAETLGTYKALIHP